MKTDWQIPENLTWELTKTSVNHNVYWNIHGALSDNIEDQTGQVFENIFWDLHEFAGAYN
jgi:hypothetical protein